MSLRDDKLNVAASMVDSQFLPGSTVQFAWDSVSLTSIMACPRRYKYQIIDGLVPNNPGIAIALVFGILFHKGLQIYHETKAHPAVAGNHDAAVFGAVRELLKMPATASLPTDDDVDELAERTDEDDDGITLRNSKIRTRYYLIRALVWYLEHYRDDPVHTIHLASGRPAVELSFRLPLDIDIAGTPLLLCGHIDRGVEFNNQLFSGDYKTTKSLTRQWFQLFSLSHQMSGYTLAGTSILDKPVSGCMIDAVALQVGQVKLNRGFTNRTPGQIGEYLSQLKWVTNQAQRYAETGDYPLNTTSCFFCEFKDICAQAPEFRDRYIRQNYTMRPGWNPLENR